MRRDKAVLTLAVSTGQGVKMQARIALCAAQQPRAATPAPGGRPASRLRRRAWGDRRRCRAAWAASWRARPGARAGSRPRRRPAGANLRSRPPLHDAKSYHPVFIVVLQSAHKQRRSSDPMHLMGQRLSCRLERPGRGSTRAER